MNRRTPIITAALLATALCLVVELPASADPGQRLSQREKVLQNLKASRQARQASKFKTHVRYVKHGVPAHLRPKAVRLNKWGPTRIPDKHIVRGGGGQPNTLFDKVDPKVKRWVRRKAAKLRMQPRRKPWDKIDYLQKVIRQKVKHAGNELDVRKNPNKYNTYNAKVSRAGQLATLGDYLRMHTVVCREMAFLTQVALEDAGFKARLVYGSIKDKNGKVLGGHAWNEIQLKGKWYIVDTTNPQFNKVDPIKAAAEGTSNGWRWDQRGLNYKVEPYNGPPLR